MAQKENKIEELIDDLMYLRKTSGFVQSRLNRATSFLEVIGGKNQIFENIKIRFISAIDSLPDKESRETLLVAYGLLSGYKGGTLKDRREKYGMKVNRKYDTLADRETAAIAELATRLLTSYYSGAPLPANLVLPHGGFLLASLYSETIMEDRKFVMHKQERQVVSLVKGAKGFIYQSNDRTKIVPIEGVTVETEYVRKGSIHKILFPKSLNVGQSHKFSFQEILENPEKYDVENEDFAGQSFETPTLKFKQKVTFKGEKPPVIWYYDKLSRIVRPGEPTEENALSFKEGDSVQKEFIQQHSGLHSGIAWRWE